MITLFPSWNSIKVGVARIPYFAAASKATDVSTITPSILILDRPAFLSCNNCSNCGLIIRHGGQVAEVKNTMTALYDCIHRSSIARFWAVWIGCSCCDGAAESAAELISCNTPRACALGGCCALAVAVAAAAAAAAGGANRDLPNIFSIIGSRDCPNGLISVVRNNMVNVNVR